MTRHYLCLVALAVVLIFGQPICASAETSDLFEKFMKCDGLMGKSPQAVLTSLGPPDDTQPFSRLEKDMHILNWHYQSISESKSLLLVFSNKSLVLAVLDPRLGERNADLAAAFKASEPSLPIMSYIKSEAEQENNLVNFVVTGTTRNGHFLRAARCSVDQIDNPQNPLTHSRVMNVNTGQYEVKFASNPSFCVTKIDSERLILAQAVGAPYERYTWTNAQIVAQEIQIQKRSNGVALNGYLENILGEPKVGETVSLPITPRNSPWFFSH